MKVQIPPSRIKLSHEPLECELLSGGSYEKTQRSPQKSPQKRKRNRDPATRTSSPQEVFMLVDEGGFPIMSGENYKLYYAKKPAFAAVKAFYAFNRNEKNTNLLPMSQFFDDIEEHVKRVTDEVSSKVYMDKVKAAKSEPPAMINIRRPEENKVRKYIVSYERVSKPNKHEIEKGIVKVAVAKQR